MYRSQNGFHQIDPLLLKSWLSNHLRNAKKEHRIYSPVCGPFQMLLIQYIREKIEQILLAYGIPNEAVNGKWCYTQTQNHGMIP